MLDEQCNALQKTRESIVTEKWGADLSNPRQSAIEEAKVELYKKEKEALTASVAELQKALETAKKKVMAAHEISAEVNRACKTYLDRVWHCEPKRTIA